MSADSAKSVCNHLRLAFQDLDATVLVVDALRELREKVVYVFGAYSDSWSWNSDWANALARW